MKSIPIVALCALLTLACCSQKTEKPKTEPATTISHLADTATYYVGLIKSAPDRAAISDEEVQRIQRAHLDNIGRLADEGLMALAGPFWTEDNTHKIRGLFWFRVANQNTADSLSATDPAVIAGRLMVENYAWLGSANMVYDTIDGMEGMRGYFASIFWRGPGGGGEPPSFDDLYANQKDLLTAACDTGRIVMAGPFTTCRREGQPTAMFIYSADSLSTIEEIVAAAPGMADGTLTALTINWYGPVGLRE